MTPIITQGADPALWKIAHNLSPAPVDAIELAGSGANSDVFRLKCAETDFALKRYPVGPDDQRDRLGVELRTLTFLTQNGVNGVPAPIASSPETGFILMEWIEGTPVGTHEPSDLQQALHFMTRVVALSSLPDAQYFPLASEACLSGRAITAQIDRRLDGFGKHPALDKFLHDVFAPLYRDAADIARAGAWAEELAPDRRRLIPADFGFHNTLKKADGQLCYFDFDYFGWDDPVKLAADFVLHPAMSLTKEESEVVCNSLVAAVPDDLSFSERLNALRPLYALRWSLILLKPFQSQFLDRITDDRQTQQSLLSAQLVKATHMTKRAADDMNNLHLQ